MKQSRTRQLVIEFVSATMLVAGAGSAQASRVLDSATGKLDSASTSNHIVINGTEYPVAPNSPAHYSVTQIAPGTKVQVILNPAGSVIQVIPVAGAKN